MKQKLTSEEWASWGMDLEGEEQMEALQADLDRADGQDGGDGEAQV